MTIKAFNEAQIEADPAIPAIRITRDFRATPAQLVRAHTDPNLFVRWVGPDATKIEIVTWDPRSGGEWRYIAHQGGEGYGFRGCFHTVSEDRLVQTFTFEPMPDAVSLETMTFEPLGDGRTRLHASSLFDSFEARDGMLASGMAEGVNDGYAKLDQLLAE